MTTAFRDSVRFILREQTAAAHSRVDARFSRLDLTRGDGLARFLGASRVALGALEPVLAAAPGLPPLPSRLALIDADLAALAAPAPSGHPAAPPAPGDPLGAAYVVAGSALGARVLRRRWARSDDQAVRKAGRFLTFTGLDGYWDAVQAALRGVPQEAGRIAGLVRGADWAFAVYETAIGESGRE